MQFSHFPDFSTTQQKAVEKAVGTVENSKNLVFSRVCRGFALWKTFRDFLSRGNMQKSVFLPYAQKWKIQEKILRFFAYQSLAQHKIKTAHQQKNSINRKIKKFEEK